MIPPRWRKVLRDLWSNKTRTILVVLSIAVGVFAVGMIAGSRVMPPLPRVSSFSFSYEPGTRCARITVCTASASTSNAWAMSSGLESSSGEWLTPPFRLRTNSIAVGTPAAASTIAS